MGHWSVKIAVWIGKSVYFSFHGNELHEFINMDVNSLLWILLDSILAEISDQKWENLMSD